MSHAFSGALDLTGVATRSGGVAPHRRRGRAVPPTPAEMATKRSVDLRLALPGARWQVLELDRPVEAEGIYGLRRTVRTLGLGLDEPALLAAALEAGAETNPDSDGR